MTRLEERPVSDLRITFLGGADEIGASCALVDFASTRLLVDCGQRMNAPPGELLPDFSLLADGPPIDAVLLTHAHTDHVGALPSLESSLSPECRIYGTEPTLAISKVMLQDSQRIIQQYRQGEGQLGHFPPSAVSSVVARFTSVPWGKATKIAGIRATWFPAGHILGAAMIELNDGKQSVLFSGDISVFDQRTVPGVFVPSMHPNVLILESTYGDRLHAHRPTQEKRLVARVAECIAKGGHVLFPTFALGRAQEVLAILADAMRDGDLDEVPVYGDGMVRSISRVYNRFPEFLSSSCRRRWEEGFDPLFPEDLPIYRIHDQQERDAVAAGPPCIVVASSGMLQGGASQFYARQWVDDPSNLILITGYQDEESPGQALLDLAAERKDEPRFFKLGGIRTEVSCGVESFELSAHADNGELISVASKLKPDVILPVHGEGGARQALAQGLMAVCRAEVILPENGGSYSIDDLASRPRPTSSRPDPFSVWPPWDTSSDRPLDLAAFHDWLISVKPAIPWITFEELAEIWRGSLPVTEEDRRQLHEAVFQDWQRYFVPDAKRPHILHITAKENLAARPESRHREGIPLATSIIREMFPSSSGLVRYGFYPEEGICQLEFQFPNAAEKGYMERLRNLEERTGWKMVPSGNATDEDLGRVASKMLGIELAGKINVDRPAGKVLVKGFSSKPNDENGNGLDDIADQFHRRTGFKLVFGSAS